MKRAKIGQGKYCDIFLTWLGWDGCDGCPGCPVWTAQSPATGAPPCWAKDQRAVNYFFLSASKTVQRQPSARECNHVIVQVQASCCMVPIRKRQAFSFLGTKPGGATFCKRRAVSTRYTLLEKYVLNFFNASSCWTLLNKYVLNVVSGARCVTTPNYWDQLLCCVHLAADRSGSVSAVVLVLIQNY